MHYLTFITGVGISAVAAYYSIVGLTTIFAGAFWPVVIMGSALEIGKLVAISWLYNNWRIAPSFLRYYLSFAVGMLMLITSMGIFGFLSKAHIEQTLALNTGVIERIADINLQIKSIEDVISDFDRQVSQIDLALNKLTERGQAQASLRAADQQKKNRDGLIKRKQDEVRKLTELRTQKIKLESEYKKIEAEVGPIKYVAELIYDGSDKDVVDKAIRFVIIILIFVFDPLAILLLLAFNISMRDNNTPRFLDMSEVRDE